MVYFLAEYVDDALTQSAGREAEQFGAIAVYGESHIGIDKNDAAIFGTKSDKGGEDIVELGGVGFEEFSTSRHIIKKILDHEIGSHGTGTRLLVGKSGTGNGDMGTYLVLRATCLQLYLSHGGDGSQRLTAEAHRVE